MAEDALIEALKAIAHPLRWRILAALATASERNVGDIEQATAIGQPTLSQQLGVLRKAGLVVTRKDAKLVFYSLAAEEVAKITAAIAALAPEVEGAAQTGDQRRVPAAPGVANFARLS